MSTVWTEIGTGTQALVTLPFDNGSVDGDQYSSLNAAIAAIGASQKTLVLGTQKSLTANLTIPSTLQLVIKQGGGITSAGFALTLTTIPVAGEYQIFFGFTAGNLIGLRKVNPKWFGTLNNTITILATNPAHITLEYPETLTANLTIPSTLALEITKDGSITKASTYILTINGPFSVGLYQVFFGFGAGDVTGLKETRPEWWGAIRNGITDDSAAFSKAISAILSRGVLDLSSGEYYLLTSVPITAGHITIQLKATTIKAVLAAFVMSGSLTAFSVIGINPRVSQLVRIGSSTSDLITWGVYTDGINYKAGNIKNVGFYGNGVATGITMSRIRYATLEDCSFINMGALAVAVREGFNVGIYHNWFGGQNNTATAQLRVNDSSTIRIRDNVFWSDDVFTNWDGSSVTTNGTTGIDFISSLGGGSTNVVIDGNLFAGPLGVDVPNASVSPVGGLQISNNYFEGVVTTMTPFRIGTTGTGNGPYNIKLDNNNIASGVTGTLTLNKATKLVMINNYISVPTVINSGVTSLTQINNEYASLTNNGINTLSFDGFILSNQTWSPGTIPNSTNVAGGFTVTGAQVGDSLIVTPPYSLDGCVFSAEVYAANLVRIVIVNLTGGSVTIGSGTWKIKVLK